MRTSLRAAHCLLPVVLLALATLTGCHKTAQRPASALTDADRAALAGYEKIRAAFAADDMREAKKAGAALAESLKPADPKDKPAELYAGAQEVANCFSLDRGRDAFKKLSAAAIAKAGDVTGYYVLSCPMTPGGDWLQTNRTVDNPYLGKAMRDCGSVRP